MDAPYRRVITGNATASPTMVSWGFELSIAMSRTSDVLGDVGVLEPLPGLVSGRMQPAPGIGGMLTDLTTHGHGPLRCSANGVKDNASRDASQTAHEEAFPDISHVIASSVSVACH